MGRFTVGTRIRRGWFTCIAANRRLPSEDVSRRELRFLGLMPPPEHGLSEADTWSYISGLQIPYCSNNRASKTGWGRLSALTQLRMGPTESQDAE
jgi:hypothetical protein